MYYIKNQWQCGEEVDTRSEDEVCKGQDIHVQAPGRQRKGGKGMLQI